MEIDLSRVIILLLAVLPGYVASLGSRTVLPRTQRKLGATEEVAAFVAISACVHLLLFVVIFPFHRDWFFLKPKEFLEGASAAGIVWQLVYLVTSLAVGWLTGWLAGLSGAGHWNEKIILKLGLDQSLLGRLWNRHVSRFEISERPIAYDALFPLLDEKGNPKTVFIKVELRNGRGIITGKVANFSILNDEEAHKLIYLRNVYQKTEQAISFEKMDADGMLLDLADALTVQIRQV